MNRKGIQIEMKNAFHFLNNRPIVLVKASTLQITSQQFNIDERVTKSLNAVCPSAVVTLPDSHGDLILWQDVHRSHFQVDKLSNITQPEVDLNSSLT